MEVWGRSGHGSLLGRGRRRRIKKSDIRNSWGATSKKWIVIISKTKF